MTDQKHTPTFQTKNDTKVFSLYKLFDSPIMEFITRLILLLAGMLFLLASLFTAATTIWLIAGIMYHPEQSQLVALASSILESKEFLFVFNEGENNAEFDAGRDLKLFTLALLAIMLFSALSGLITTLVTATLDLFKAYRNMLAD